MGGWTVRFVLSEWKEIERNKWGNREKNGKKKRENAGM